MSTELASDVTHVKREKKDKSEKKRKRDKLPADDSLQPASTSISTPKKHRKSDPLAEKANDVPSRPGEEPRSERHGKSFSVEKGPSASSHSPFLQETVSFYLTLSPCAHNFALQGVCAEHISPLLLTYFAPLKGVLLSYSNPRLSEVPDAERHVTTVHSKSIDEYAVTFVWLTADFLIFRPQKGCYLEGYVNLQTENLLGLMCYNYFNAAIDRAELPPDWTWQSNESLAQEGREDQTHGHFVDGSGQRVDGRVVFRVRDFDVVPGSDANSGSMIHIYGSLLSRGKASSSREAP